MLLDPNIEALNAYDDLYYELDSENKSVNDSQDFHEPLQSSDRHLQIKSEDKSHLEGNQERSRRWLPNLPKRSMQPPRNQHYISGET